MDAATKRIAEALQAALADYRLDGDADVQSLSRHIAESPARAEVEAALRAAEQLSYHDRPDVIQLHRVIGGYIERFSLLIFQMRGAMSMLLRAIRSTRLRERKTLAGHPFRQYDG